MGSAVPVEELFRSGDRGSAISTEVGEALKQYGFDKPVHIRTFVAKNLAT